MRAIICFGDSITYGMGQNGGWAGRLKQHFETPEHKAVYNLGVPGDDTNDLLQRFDIEVEARLWDIRPGDNFLILIAVGVNDCKFDGDKPRMEEKTFENNMKKLLAKAKKFKNAKVACIGIIPVDEKRTQPYEETSFSNERVTVFNNILKKSCEDIPFFDIFEIMVKEDYPTMLEDGLHPTAEGFDFMFTQIKEFLEENSLLP